MPNCTRSSCSRKPVRRAPERSALANLPGPPIFEGATIGEVAMADEREDVYSRAVRAGKRTYFFDVKSTRGKDLYLTITESKKHTHEDGSATYEKHKIFLYKEDFEKFLDGYQDALAEIERLRGTGDYVQDDGRRQPESGPSSSDDLRFEDLG